MFEAVVTRGSQDFVRVYSEQVVGTAGAVTVSQGMKMYQINEEGLIVGVSITGAKYYKDKELD